MPLRHWHGGRPPLPSPVLTPTPPEPHAGGTNPNEQEGVHLVYRAFRNGHLATARDLKASLLQPVPPPAHQWQSVIHTNGNRITNLQSRGPGIGAATLSTCHRQWSFHRRTHSRTHSFVALMMQEPTPTSQHACLVRGQHPVHHPPDG